MKMHTGKLVVYLKWSAHEVSSKFVSGTASIEQNRVVVIDQIDASRPIADFANQWSS